MCDRDKRCVCVCVTVIPAAGECWGEKRDMCVAGTECEHDICSKFPALHSHSFIELS